VGVGEGLRPGERPRDQRFRGAGPEIALATGGPVIGRSGLRIANRCRPLRAGVPVIVRRVCRHIGLIEARLFDAMTGRVDPSDGIDRKCVADFRAE